MEKKEETGESKDFKEQLKTKLLAAFSDQGLPSSSSIAEMAEKKMELEYRRILLSAIVEITQQEMDELLAMRENVGK